MLRILPSFNDLIIQRFNATNLGTNVELRAWTQTADYAAVINDLLAQCPGALAQANVKDPDKTLYYVERK